MNMVKNVTTIHGGTAVSEQFFQKMAYVNEESQQILFWNGSKTKNRMDLILQLNINIGQNIFLTLSSF